MGSIVFGCIFLSLIAIANSIQVVNNDVMNHPHCSAKWMEYFTMLAIEQARNAINPSRVAT